MTTEGKPVCELCMEAVVASAKRAQEDFENPEFVHMLALKFGNRISDHFCLADEDDAVDCNCSCLSGILSWDESFGTVTTRGDVCDPCLEAAYDAMEAVGERLDDILYTYMMARQSGGDIFDHECAADDVDEDEDEGADEAAECHCGCQR